MTGNVVQKWVHHYHPQHLVLTKDKGQFILFIYFYLVLEIQPCVVDAVGHIIFTINQGSHLLVSLFWTKDESNNGSMKTHKAIEW